MYQENTVGSRSGIDLAYIAGFLDGDGSLMFQIKKRADGRKKWRFMATICLYQDSRHEAPLKWIRNVFGTGYFSRRNDGMSELRINGFRQTNEILDKLLPYIRFKKKQASAMRAASSLLIASDGALRESDLRKIVTHILAIQSENYATRRKRSEAELLKMLGLTP